MNESLVQVTKSTVFVATTKKAKAAINADDLSLLSELKQFRLLSGDVLKINESYPGY